MKLKTCKACKEKFEPIRPLQQVCSPACAYNYQKKAFEKKMQKEKVEKKKELMTLSDWLKIAQTTFNAYIRKRDKGNVCISCQKPAKKENAGHFFNANNHYMVRFDEDNVHLQCEYCNTYLHGNLIEYRENLITKIGFYKFSILKHESDKTRKFSIDELKEIISVYKAKVKILEKR
jgi:hypothetical protein